MSGLPKGWEVATPLDAASPIRGVTYKKEQARDAPKSGYTAILRANNIQNDKVVMDDLVYVPDENIQARQRLKVGDIVIAMSSGSISVVGKSAQLKDEVDASFGAFCGALRPNEEIDARYVGHFLKSDVYRNAISDMARGVNINNLKWSHFEEIDFPIAPLPEQTRIADKLDALLARVDAARARLDRVPALLKRFRQSVLAAATSGALTEDWRGGTEAEWEEVALSEVIAPNRPLCYGVVQPGAEDAGGASLIRVQDMQDGRILVDELRTIAASVDHDFRRSRVEAGDLLVSVVGTIGRTAIVPAGLNANIARAVARIACRDGIDSRWVRAWLSTDDMQWWLINSSKEVARKTLNLSDLSTAPIKLPPPDEQTEIIRRVEALFALADQVQARYGAARARVDKLTPALLAKAFRGELVPQDPNDEPASVLLERLRAGKAENGQPASPKRRKAGAAAAR